MTQVSNESDFRAALSRQESPIEITSDFSLSSQIQITYDVTVKSVAGSIFTLTRGSSFFSYLIRIAGGVLTLENIVIDGDKTNHPITNETNRSLVFVTGGTFILGDGAVLQNNNAFREGGGVYLSGAVNYTNTMVMNGSAAIVGCHSESNGGGIMFAARHKEDRITITDDALIQNNSAPNGGGLYLRSYDQNTGIDVEIDGRAKITENTVTGNGGGIYFSGFRNNGPLSSLTITDDVVISENRALHGGGLYFFSASDGDILQIQPQVSISQNTASQNGGGIMITAAVGQVDFSLEGVDLRNNRGGTGGGLYLLTDTGAEVHIAESTITDNHAVNDISGNGGGIWVQNRAEGSLLTFSLENSTIERNTAALQGGGIALWGGSGGFRFDALNNKVHGNTAQTNGGGLLLSSAGVALLTFEGNTVTQNSADSNGGGLYFANLTDTASSRLEINGDRFQENTAGAEGGGIRLTASFGTVETLLTDCTISANMALSSNGGGIWAGGAGNRLTLQGNTIVTENTAESRNGGGIYFNSTTGTLVLTDQVEITANRTSGRGGGVCAFTGSLHMDGAVEIAYNTSQNYGGGISASEGALVTVESGTIHDNTALGQGGGVWVRGGSVFAMNGGSLYGNHAEIGGGLYNDVESTARITGNAFIGSPGPNTADKYAPGIYNEGMLYVSGNRHLSNGVYLTEQIAAVRIEGPLAPGSIIQLDNSDYVTANSEGIPIVVGVVSPPYTTLTQQDADAFQKPPAGFEDWEIRLSDDQSQVLLAPVLHTDHTVTFKGNDGWCCPKACHIPRPLTVTSGTSVTIPRRKPLWCNHRFIGWNTASDGSGIFFQPGGVIDNIREDLTLFAIWKRCWF